MFTAQEHIENLNRLGIDSYYDLVGQEVYYVKQSYGIHTVIEYDEEKELFILELDGQKFETNPFRIHNK